MMHFQAETLYLAVYLLNRCLHQTKVTTENLQLLGMVCLFLAAKKEESLLPEVHSPNCEATKLGFSRFD